MRFFILISSATILSFFLISCGGGDPVGPGTSEPPTCFSPIVQNEWANTWGGSGADVGYGVAIDSFDNVYVAGHFSQTVDFDPGPGNDSRTSKGETDIFLSKFDSSGELLWARTWGGGGKDFGYAVAVDSEDNVYVAGTFSQTVDFNPGPQDNNKTSNGKTDIFLSKFDSSGGYLWTLTWGGKGDDCCWDIMVDSRDNIWVTGFFNDTVDFDPGPGVVNFTSNGSSDAFLSGFDSSGAFILARTWGGTGVDVGYGISIDKNDSIYVTGSFARTVNFNPGPGVASQSSNGFYDAFLVKYDTSGDFKWTRAWGGKDLDESRGIAVDSSSNIYVIGVFDDVVDFDPGPGVDLHTASRCYGNYLCSYDSSGEFRWARTWGGSSGDQDRSVMVDRSDNIYITGAFYGSFDFNPGDEVDIQTSNKNYDVFLSRYDSSGGYKWTCTFGGIGWEFGRDLAADSSGNVYITGLFEETVDFDLSDGVDFRTVKGNSDIFLIKFPYVAD